ncbi:MAG TPA: glycosyltransferase family 39 protein [Terriglobales bacterium]|nr:glycosyltransferase family 39 protein [Terriglobales bacterium]
MNAGAANILTRPLSAAQRGTLVLGLISVYAAVALYWASAAYLNPDEATFYPSIAADTVEEAYVAARRHPHPPLWPMLLSLVSQLADSPTALRLPSVVAAGLGVWFTYRWIELLAGSTAALCGAGFLLSSFALLGIASEVRPYAGLWLFETATLWAVEAFVQQRSWRPLTALTLAMAAAVLSHYSMIFVAAALGIYVCARLLPTLPARRWLMPWAIGQAMVIAVAGWALFIHGAEHSGRITRGETLWWVRAGVWGRESFVEFLGRIALGIWQHIETGTAPALAAAALFLAGIYQLLRNRLSPTCGPRRYGGWATLLLLLPFLVSLAAAAQGAYPSGRSRHTNFLLPLAAAGVGAGAAALLRGRERLAGVAAIAVTIVSLIVRVPNNNPKVYDPQHVRAAVDYLRNEVPPGATLFIDGQSGNAISYYLRRHGEPVTRWRGRGRPHLELIGLSFVRVRPPQWELSPRSLRSAVPATARQYGFRAGDEIWVLSTGWNNKSPLTQGLPRQQWIDHRSFGRIQIVRMRQPPRHRPGSG